MTEAVSLWNQEYSWYLFSFRLEQNWHNLSVSCDISFVLKPVNLFYRLKILQPSCLHYGSKFLTHPSWWWKRDKHFTFLFCFPLSQECLRNSIPVPNEELVFKRISTYLRALLLRNWDKFCVHIRRTEMVLFFLLFYRDFAHWAFGGFEAQVWVCRTTGSGQAGASCCSSTGAGDSHPRWAAAGMLVGVCCLHCAACTVLVAGWAGRRGQRCNSSSNFPCKPKPSVPMLAPSPRESPQEEALSEDHWFSETCIDQPTACLCASESWICKDILRDCCCSCYG